MSTIAVQRGRGVALDWNVLWADFVQLLPVLGPTFIGSATGIGWWVKRRDDRAAAAIRRAEELQDKKAQALLDQRASERKEMAEEREAFYDDIKREVANLRQSNAELVKLYSAEQDRGLTLRASLAEAAQRERQLQMTIVNLTDKVEELQSMVGDLRRELAAAARASRENVAAAIHATAHPAE